MGRIYPLIYAAKTRGNEAKTAKSLITNGNKRLKYLTCSCFVAYARGVKSVTWGTSEGDMDMATRNEIQGLKIGMKVWYRSGRETLPAIIEGFGEKHGELIVDVVIENEPNKFAANVWGYRNQIKAR